MSENLHLSAMGLLRPADIGGEACEGCEHNERGKSCALVFGGGEALRACADLLFEDCEIAKIGTKARIKELETALQSICKECEIKDVFSDDCAKCNVKLALEGRK